MNAEVDSRRVLILISLLGLIAVLSTVWPAYRAFLDIEIDINEGWNAYFADAAMGRMSLYPSRDRLITNNYPPLSFYIVGGFGKLLGDTVVAGRILSLLAVAAIALGVAFGIRQLGGNGAAATIGALYYIATMCRFFSEYVGMNDPQLLGQAIMTVGFVAFLRAMERNRGYAVPFLIMLFAGFIKHNIIAMPLTCVLWLGIHQPRQMMKIGLLCMGLLAAGFATCYATYGPDFFANMMTPRIYNWKLALGAVGHLQWLAVGLAAWFYVAGKIADPRVKLCNLFIILGLVNFFFQKLSEGVASNAQFELAIGVSIGVGLVFAHMPNLPLAQRNKPEAIRTLFLLAICLRLLASTNCQPVRLLFDANFHKEIAAREAAMSDTVARIKMAPGDVVSNTLACYWAGKPFVVDPFNCNQRMKTGNIPPDTLNKLITDRVLTYVIEDPLLSWSHK
jgi:4-amino-4-deoxy-L-arabinose transferase-like glycosyltransferase